MKKITFTHRISKHRGYDEMQASGYKFEHMGFDFIAHRYIDRESKRVSSESWVVSELSTGLWLGAIADTKKKTIEQSIAMLNKRGKESIAEVIDLQLKALGLKPRSEQEISRMLNEQRLAAMVSDHENSINYQMAKLANYC